MKALIITPFLTKSIRNTVNTEAYDLILCADSAYLPAAREGITPHVIIGDFDHDTDTIPKDTPARVITVPSEKDDTDTMLCLKYAIAEGAREVTILGGIGGRLDHTFANLQSLYYAEKEGIPARLVGSHDEAFLVTREGTVPRRDGWYLSVFAFGGDARGVTISGTKYEVADVSLCSHFPLGVSNEITEKEAKITVNEGVLLMILSKKE